MLRRINFLLLYAACLGFLPMQSAAAQERNQGTSENAQSQTRSQDRTSSSGSSESARSKALKLQGDPMATVVIGIDLDSDNEFDAFEQITYYDLQLARMRSKQRQDRTRVQSDAEGSRNSDSAMREQRSNSDTSNQNSGSDQREPLKRFVGTVTQPTRIRLVDGPEHDFVKLQLQDGSRIPVDLGRTDRPGQMTFEEGQKITVWGSRGRVDDKRVLVARRIQVGDQTMERDREQDRDLKRVRGEVLDTATINLQNSDEKIAVAKVDLNGGRTETVVLGPANRLGDVSLTKGDEVQMLVRRGSLGQRQVLIADQLKIGERVYSVVKPQRSDLIRERNINRQSAQSTEKQ